MFPGEKTVLTEQNPVGGRKTPRLVFVAGKTAYIIGGDRFGADFLDVLCQETDDWAYVCAKSVSGLDLGDSGEDEL